MRVIIEHHDSTSFLPEEVIRQAQQAYGARASVTLLPDSDTPIDHLYFAIQRLITGDLLSIFYDSGPTFPNDLAKLKSEMLYKVSEVMDDVVNDVLTKLNQEE